jgi:hypothetical protein
MGQYLKAIVKDSQEFKPELDMNFKPTDGIKVLALGKDRQKIF